MNISVASITPSEVTFAVAFTFSKSPSLSSAFEEASLAFEEPVSDTAEVADDAELSPPVTPQAVKLAAKTAMIMIADNLFNILNTSVSTDSKNCLSPYCD